ncbi:MBL fold metallo-hydrolase [Chengkuizengella axinellae]|uniref:MBL fold metallo-hydrolase n=1 Tax=Chengkuizengella axinellae TaxID=3064388 RepID=A0ABT9J370_9BACL|nr:MBL fold metallo-hydrolase [Chengkuizengella sp. 2205SS18-9]MDP5276035.1 MBL fold metallo-hydrolase [Chengkuizengella sp. 2205SS18-9]
MKTVQKIKKIGERFYYMTPVSETDRPILGMIVGDKKILMIDSGNSEAHAQYFINELSKKQISKPDIVALTHWHWDHIFGLSSLTNTVSISSKETAEEMKKLIPLSWSDEAIDERVKEGTEIEFCANAIKEEFVYHRDITITLPTLTFENRLEIDLGGVTCILQQVGGDHASDSVVAYIKEEKVLFLGDCIYPDIFSYKTNYTIERILSLLEVLEAFEAETYIYSHGTDISKKEFNQEVILLKSIAKYTELSKGDKESIKDAYSKQVERELNDEELETIEFFVNGYQMNNEI